MKSLTVGFLDNIEVSEVYGENFYYWQFSSIDKPKDNNSKYSNSKYSNSNPNDNNTTSYFPHMNAKVYFWTYENKITLEDFKILPKRKGYGKSLFIYILNYLKSKDINSFYVSSRNTEEAYGFWQAMTGKSFNSTKFEHLIFVRDTLSYLNF